MLTVPVILLMVAGTLMVGAGLLQGRRAGADPAAYLDSLDDDRVPDEFGDVLSEPFFSRVLRPAGDRVFSLVASITPVGQRDKARQSLVLAGLAGRVRAEDFLALQLVSALVGLLLGTAYLAYGSGARNSRIALGGLMLAIGVLGPRSWLARKVKDRKLRAAPNHVNPLASRAPLQMSLSEVSNASPVS
ncbi:MAG: hypothetical protein NVS3B20_04690 [Polyangiales bacterium]